MAGRKVPTVCLSNNEMNCDLTLRWKVQCHRIERNDVLLGSTYICGYLVKGDVAIFPFLIFMLQLALTNIIVEAPI